MAEFLLNGALLGLSVAAPLGPVSLVGVQRSLRSGLCGGIASGLGAATAQGTFALAALAGSEMVASHLMQWRQPIHFASAGVLVALGLRTVLRRRPAGRFAKVMAPGMAYFSTFLLSLCNPMTILPYMAIASATFVGGSVPIPISPVTVPGVVLGAVSWCCALSASAVLLRGRLLRPSILSKLNAAAGACLVSFGMVVALD